MIQQKIEIDPSLTGKARRDACFAARHPDKAKEERVMRRHNAKLQDRFGHKREGTVQTHDKASRTRQGALARMFMSGHISTDQLAFAAEISEIANRIAHDGATATVSLETRVDNGGGRWSVFEESLGRVRREVAYSSWRSALAKPALVLTMIVGDTAVRTAARRFRMRDSKARKILIDALDAWPDHCRDARERVDVMDIAIVQARLA